MTSDSAVFPCSDQFGHLMLEGAREIIGQAGVNAVVNRAQVLYANDPVTGGDAANVGHIQAALEELYGQRGGQGVALRAGRSGFNHLLRAEGKTMGLTETNYRMLPSQARIFVGLQLLAQKLSAMIARPVEVEEQAACWLWRMENEVQQGSEGLAQNRCFFIIGFLQEYLMWASGGKYHNVQEVTEGEEPGKMCIVQLEKHSL
ncbi:MAG: hypothetical protein RBT34_01005 [Anaerolineaceae bacterium]|jgi:hypothetical protein|nr:hypothetical protein [Anaerolineaceae bacterium]